ncbi:D-2-hydroxyacid dehydrogenase [Mangrovimicrobium sediminis]|uniref:D-2-hydroxyacid dehydrogenase n=1 Tax=Mangrovimicrobium sediminis TaxID=2562682 RepID=A0A4Z0M616_9GAMM|nr:D-2-hydroxyacid dehydrogenase [Haliea sp. SAOS-164]TGD74745.1 D-2-hydroxyacid dehydrogenase [Haliea sp. SAOS-164]
MGDTINVCVCVPLDSDTRTAAEHAATERAFQALEPRLRFTYAAYSDPPEIRALRGQPDYARARELLPPPAPALRDALREADIAFAIDLPFDMHELAPRLRWVQSIGAGIGQLQSCGLDRLGAALTSGAGIASPAIAEFVIARILAHWKLFDRYAQMQAEHRWETVYGHSLAGSVLGIVGLGAIGEATAQRAHALGMRVIATRRDPASGAPPSVEALYRPAQLPELLGAADAVVLCAAETAQTYRLFDREAFAAMRPGSYFCNVSRGSLVDEDALREALCSGHLGGASIDVTVAEPLPANSPLWDTPNLHISPHSAGSLDHFFDRAWELFLDNMRRYLAGEPMRNQCSNRREEHAG